MIFSRLILHINKPCTIFVIQRSVLTRTHVPLTSNKVIQEPKLWYGIGILYDRYGSLEYAEEAFSQVMRMQPDFEKANEIYFRLGIIYKQQQKYKQSLEVIIPALGGLAKR
jgi:lipoprotein NlpI